MVIFRDFRVNNSTNRPPSLQVIVGVEGFFKRKQAQKTGIIFTTEIKLDANVWPF